MHVLSHQTFEEQGPVCVWDLLVVGVRVALGLEFDLVAVKVKTDRDEAKGVGEGEDRLKAETGAY